MIQPAHQMTVNGSDSKNSSVNDATTAEKVGHAAPSNHHFALNATPPGHSEPYLFTDYSGGGEDDHLFGRKMPKTLHWSVPWSDLMMTMFIFFAVMYANHIAFKEVPSKEILSELTNLAMTVPTKVDETAWEPGNDTIPRIYDLSRETLSRETLGKFASLELVPDKAVRIILTGDLLFDPGMAELKETAKASLRELSDFLRKTPYMVNLVGHTDDVPIRTEAFPSNWELSTARASEVARFLIEEMAIPPERFFISGHASYQPIKPNNTAQDRAANRRVEIIITKERPYGIARDIEGTGPGTGNLF